MLKFTIAQINPTIGDIVGNIALMRRAAQAAAGEGSELVIFPELSLTGYYPADMLEDPAFMERVGDGLASLLVASREHPHLAWVIGAPTRNLGAGKPLHNSLLVLKAGQVVLAYHKQLLPTYDVFDERRHFEPGPDTAAVLAVGESRVRVGFVICEDAWNDEGHTYSVNPLERLAAAAPELVVSINASPSNMGKQAQREAVFTHAAKRHGFPIVYVNQVGGHDQLVYDGASFVVDPTRGVVYTALDFEPHAATLSVDREGHLYDCFDQPIEALERYTLTPSAFYHAQIMLGLKDYARRCGFSKAVIGSSGGIDSALTLALAAEALGPENVVAITMPSAYSSTGSVEDSVRLCDNLGVRLYTHPIGELVDTHACEFKAATGQDLRGVALENLQARIRGTILMEYSNQFGHLLLTTGNKSEISVGYCTLYGDTNGGLGVLGDLYKTEVFALARHVNALARREVIPLSIIEKPPSAELAPDQQDTDSLPPYEILDEILKLHIEGRRLSAKELEHAEGVVSTLKESEEGRELIKRVHRMVARNEYKRRQAPPILRVRARAFGSGRQMPIAAHYE